MDGQAVIVVRDLDLLAGLGELHTIAEALAARNAKVRRAAAGLGCAAFTGQP